MGARSEIRRKTVPADDPVFRDAGHHTELRLVVLLTVVGLRQEALACPAGNIQCGWTARSQVFLRQRSARDSAMRWPCMARGSISISRIRFFPVRSETEFFLKVN
jgi:hypothetical protein